MNDRIVEIKAFVLAKAYELLLRFYADMGFPLASEIHKPFLRA